MGTLYLVATPIGNLEDISARALRILGQVNLIAAEDTRHTGKLLEHFQLHKPLTSYHEHNKLVKLDQILNALEHGDVALVSDAGTPILNDPGLELVQAVINAGYTVSPIPGPSAPLAALTVSGLAAEAFLYLGYLPRKASDRQKLLDGIRNLPYTLIFLETPHRLLDALQDLESRLGNRLICVARELTKLHEEIYRNSVSQARLHFSSQPIRGEFTLIVAGAPQELSVWSEEKVTDEVHDGLTRGEPGKQLAARLAGQSGWSRRKIYQMILVERGKASDG